MRPKFRNGVSTRTLENQVLPTKVWLHTSWQRTSLPELEGGRKGGTGSTLESMAREPSNPSLSGEWGIICLEGAHLSSASITKFVKLLRGAQRGGDNVILERDSEIFCEYTEVKNKRKKDFNLSEHAILYIASNISRITIK